MNGDEITARAPWQDEDEEEYESDMEDDCILFGGTLVYPWSWISEHGDADYIKQ